MTKTKIQKLTFSAIMIALSSVLSLIKVVQMPLGGSVTLLSMVPVCMIGIMYGTAYAILPCFVYGIIQIFLGQVFSWGLTPLSLIACIFIDYILAYTSMSLSGLFRKNKKWGVFAGVALACVVRLAFHILSGRVLFASFEVFNNPLLYSVCYNGAYMLPELVITCIGTFLLTKVKFFEKFS